MTDQTISHYHQQALHYQAQYDSVEASDVHTDWAPLLTEMAPGLALDIGAGSGRDALWLAQQGWVVTAVEPAEALRHLGQRKTGSTVKWINDQLPKLDRLPIPAQGFDLILLSAVWMHLMPEHRPTAFQRLHECLSPEGVMIITLRFGPSDPNRPMYTVSVEELNQLAQKQSLKLEVLSQGLSNDSLQRNEIRWNTLCLKSAGEHGG